MNTHSFYYTKQEELVLCETIQGLAHSRDLVWHLPPVKNEIRKNKALPEKLREIVSREFEKRNKLHNEFFRCAHLITPFPQDLVALAETLMHANRHGWKYERVPSLSEEHAPFETLKRETLRLTELALIAGNFAWQKVIVDRKNKRFPQTNTSCTTRFYSLYWAIRA